MAWTELDELKKCAADDTAEAVRLVQGIGNAHIGATELFFRCREAGNALAAALRQFYDDHDESALRAAYEHYMGLDSSQLRPARAVGIIVTAETNLIDCAWTKPTPQAVKAAGYAGVIGYISHDAGKDLTAKVAKRYLAAGLKVALVFETTATEAEHGTAAGIADCEYAERRAKAMGYPDDAPIFYAVDEDVPASKVASYFGGIDQTAKREVGVYGSLRVVDDLMAHSRIADYGWQTAAWSGGQLSQHASLYQRTDKQRPKIAGVAHNTYDENVVLRPLPLWGGVVAPPGEKPQPKPATKAKASPLGAVTDVCLSLAAPRLAKRKHPLDDKGRARVAAAVTAGTRALEVK